MTAGVEGVIKTDVLGRMRTSAARRTVLLEEFDKSGLSAKKFSELIGVKYQTLATWLQKRRRKQVSVKAADTVKWLEAVVEQAQPAASAGGASAIVLQWEGGARMEISDVKQIPLAAALVRALAHS